MASAGPNNKIQMHFYTHALLVNIANVINYRRGKIRLIMNNEILQRNLAGVHLILYNSTIIWLPVATKRKSCTLFERNVQFFL